MLPNYTIHMTPAELQFIGVLVGSLLTVFFGLNAWFFKRLVSKLDALADQVGTSLPTHSERMDNLSRGLASLEEEIKHIRDDFRDVSDLKSRVAVLEFALRESSAKPNSGGFKQ